MLLEHVEQSCCTVVGVGAVISVGTFTSAVRVGAVGAVGFGAVGAVGDPSVLES